jgi:endoglucanase
VSLAAVAGCGGGGGGGDQRSAAASSATTGTPRERAVAAGRAFLDRYVDADGRVVRRDQGGDTVSEGQAYAMLVAVALKDERTFHRVWGWSTKNLARGDGLLSWHWADGRVADPQPAADADVDAAHALTLAAQRFDEPKLAATARAMAGAIRQAEVRDGILMAAPWAKDRGLANPSYFDPRGLAALGLDDVAEATRSLVATVTAGGSKPPTDWATIGPPAAPAGPPNGSGPPTYGYDAARVAVRLASSCDDRDRQLAANLVSLKTAAPAQHPVFTVARAAVATARHDDAHARDLLDAASTQDRASPTYYGAAWVALGRILLDTDLLGTCSMR